MTTNYKRKFISLLLRLKHIYDDIIKVNYNNYRWIFSITDMLISIRKDKILWTKDYYYQKISILEDVIFNKTIDDDYIIDKCIMIINKYKII